jgi:hypothetical protein
MYRVKVAATVAVIGLMALIVPGSNLGAAHAARLVVGRPLAIGTKKTLPADPVGVVAPAARGGLVVRVVDSSGRAVAGARVHIKHPHRRAPQFHLRTGAGGAVSARVGNGRWVVRARRPGVGNGRARTMVQAGSTSQVVVMLHGARHSFHPHQQHLLGTRLPTLRQAQPAGAVRPTNPAASPVPHPAPPTKLGTPPHKAPHATNGPEGGTAR